MAEYKATQRDSPKMLFYPDLCYFLPIMRESCVTNTQLSSLTPPLRDTASSPSPALPKKKGSD